MLSDGLDGVGLFLISFSFLLKNKAAEISKNVSHQMSFVVNRRFASPPTV
jgi:hypothetical protein